MKVEKNIRELVTEIGVWAVSNYDYIDTVGYGMIKQMGRWASAQLKFKQAYRKAKDKGYLKLMLSTETRLALGDCLIFLMNWCFIKDITISLEEAESYVHFNRKKHDLIPVGLIIVSIGQIFNMHESLDANDPIIRRPYAQRIFNNLALLCHLMGEEVMWVLNHRWRSIRILNWRKFPKDGLTK